MALDGGCVTGWRALCSKISLTSRWLAGPEQLAARGGSVDDSVHKMYQELVRG